MKLFNHKPDASTVRPRTSTRLCQARGCVSYDAEPCAYVDRRGRHCDALFCPTHHEVIDGAVFCRRHAGTLRALGEKGQERFGLPDVDNRGPSLVNWIARDLDDRVRALLESVARPGETVVVEPEVTMAYDVERRPRWERSWKLVEHTGLVLKVTINVHQHEDALVTVRVGREMVAKGIPPWIVRRRDGDRLPESAERAQRQLFYRFLEENITVAVHRLRQRADHPTWVA